MALTPDRSDRGIDYDDAVQLADRGAGDPSIAAQMCYSLGAMRFRDSVGVYDPRTVWANLLDGGSIDAPGTLYQVILGAVAPSSVTWYSDAAKTKKVCSTLYTYAGANPLMPTTIVYSVFAADGSTLYKKATDTITYSSGVFEASRTRVFA